MDPWLESFARANFLRSGDTAHDLKTPLNVAVLNLELLRMRLRKLNGGEDDEKLAGYAKAIEVELRRMGRIFDTFFLLSTPPKEEALHRVDVGAIAAEAASSFGYELPTNGAVEIEAHEGRIRQALRLFFEGASKLLKADGRRVAAGREESRFTVTVAGIPDAEEDFELSKIFKFYYSDVQGNPDLSLAAARLIAETYGGEVNAGRESDKVSLRLSLPLR
ncbi:MAG TPA: histidine kinase dimerization/phospho-acceptor domain-containing protein [Thermoanaerobaculia bacterium]|jgi:K+-sensing histidine kinase KdpD